MPYCEPYMPEPDLQILIWHLTEEPQELLAMWGDAALPESYRPDISAKRKKEILAEGLLLRGYFGEDKTLHHYPDGRPYIDGSHISISHTFAYVVIALHATAQIGIDIESLGFKAVRAAKRFLHPDELRNLSGNGKVEAVHICWSAKEALYKLHSIEGVDFANDIRLAPLGDLPKGSVQAVLSYIPDKVFEVQYELFCECSLAYVVEP